MIPIWFNRDGGLPRQSFNRAVRRFFAQTWSVKRTRDLLLVGLISNPPHQIAIAHLVKAFTNNARLKVVAFVDPANTHLSRRQAAQQSLAYRVRSWGSQSNASTFARFGARALIYPAFSPSQKARAAVSADLFYATRPTKWDVEDFRIEGILIGDLIYDDYLKKFGRGTVNTESKEFRDHFTESLKVFFFWREFFGRFHVRAVIADSVYRQGIVARVATAAGVEAFDAQVSRVVRLTGDCYQFEDTQNYRSEFNSMKDKSFALRLARQALLEKVGGKPDLSNAHFMAPAGNRSVSRVLPHTDTPKILVAPHCFSDSAHAFGKMLFPDFQEWLTFLASVAATSDYEWYLKPHPRGAEDIPIIKEIFSNCHNLSILNHDASLQQLADEGLTVALTMRGHIGFDFPLMGVPVISCTPGYRYQNYRFNIQARSLEHYRELLSNLDLVPREISSRELEEFYYMDTIHNHPNIFFPDLIKAQTLSSQLGHEGILATFSQTVSAGFIEETVQQLEEFIRTDALRFRRRAISSI